MSGRLNGRLNGSGEGVDARRGSVPRKISGGESGASEAAGGIGGVGWREADGAVRSARKVLRKVNSEAVVACRRRKAKATPE